MMLKRITLLLFLCILSFSGFAQQNAVKRVYTGDAAKAIDGKKLNRIYNQERDGQVRSEDYSSDKTSDLTVERVGDASNPYTIIRNSVSQVIAQDNADDTKDVVAWIRRNSVDDFPGTPLTTANGVTRIDFMAPENAGYCVQGKWALDVGPFNPLPYPNTCRPRYPQGVFYTPPGATSFNDTRVVWLNSCTDGNSWGNYNWGMSWNLCRFGAHPQGKNGTNTAVGDFTWSSFLGAQQDNMTLIPNGLCNGRPGEVWFVDNSYRPSGADGDLMDSVYVYKGIVREKDVQWKRHATLRLGRGVQFYNRAQNNTPEIGTANIDFSPDGKWGWVALTAVVQDDPTNPRAQKEFEQKPVFFWSDNYGETWNGPLVVRLRDYSQVRDSIRQQYIEENGDTVWSSGVPVMYGAPELAVDKNGNPHVFGTFVNAARQVMDGKLDSLGYFQAIMSMFDITTDDNGRTWCPKFIHRNQKYAGTVPGTNLTFSNFNQIARDPSGEHIFYSWIDDSTSRTNRDAMKPNLHQRALRISDGAMTDVEVVSYGSLFQDKVFFPALAPVVLTKSGGNFELPTVFASGIRNEQGTTQFSFIKDRTINSSEFKVKTSDVALEIMEPTDRICFGGEVPVKVRITNVGQTPVRDSVVVTYLINGVNPVREVARLTAPLASNASVEYTFTRRANISASGSYALDALSTVKDDEICSNHYKQRRVLNFGGTARQIFDRNTFSGCGSVTVNTGLVGSTHKWTVDGTAISGDGPMQTFDRPGTYQVVCEVTNNDCPGEPLRGTITVTVNEVPPITVQRNVSACQKDSPNGVDLQINSGGADFEYRWFRRVSATQVEEAGRANTLNIRQNADLIARVRNRVTGCVDSQEVRVRIWDIKANIARLKTGLETACGRQNIDASNETTGEGCTYVWYVRYPDSTGAATQWSVQQRSGASTFRALSNYEMKPICYRVEILDPQGCNQASPSTDSVCFVTSESEPITFPDGTTGEDRLESFAKSNFEIAEESAATRSKIPVVRPNDETNNNTDAFLKGTVHFKEDFTAGGTKVTGRRFWIEANDRQFVRAFRYDGNQWIRINDLSDASPDLVNLECMAVYVRSSSSRPNIRVEHRVYSSFPQPTPTSETIGCQAKYIYLWDAVVGTGDVQETEPDNRCSPKPVGRSEYAANYEVSVYPNPSNGVYQITAGLPSVSDLDVQVYDINGRMVYNARWNGSDSYNQAIDLSSVSSGVYILKLTGEQGFVSHRLVKE